MAGLTKSHLPTADPLRTSRAPQGGASVHLDALRGLAAFCVMLAHWRLLFFAGSLQFSKTGLLASIVDCFSSFGCQWVMVFFVLSGYLVGGSVLHQVTTGCWSWGEYLFRRLSRLYIVLLPALALGAMLDWARAHAAGSGTLAGLRGTLTLPVFLANASFLESTPLHLLGHGPADGMIPVFGSNIPLWSLSYEFWYYMAFPLLALAMSPRQSRRARLAYTLALLVWAWFVGERIMVFWIPWLIGVAIRSLPPFPELRSLWAQRAATGMAMAALAMGIFLSVSKQSWLTQILVAECAAILIWVVTSCATTPLPLWYRRLAQRAARSSYTLYLVHLPMLFFLKFVFHPPVIHAGWRLFTTALAVMAATLAYAQLVYELFEKHTGDARAWMLQQWACSARRATHGFAHLLSARQRRPAVSVNAERISA
jgi:peptidoglycan/LPS O-acetylase OafA/YrhL